MEVAHPAQQDSFSTAFASPVAHVLLAVSLRFVFVTSSLFLIQTQYITPNHLLN